MTAPEAFEELLRPVFAWLEHGGDAEAACSSYWRTRDRLMDGGEVFGGPGANWLSNIDVATDAFSPDPDRTWFEIDEAQLKRELSAAVQHLIAEGHFVP